jgi:hypothetical protein
VLLSRIDCFTGLFITSLKTDLLLLVEMVNHLSDLLFDKYYVGAAYLERTAENKEFFAIRIEKFFHEFPQFRDALEGLDLRVHDQIAILTLIQVDIQLRCVHNLKAISTQSLGLGWLLDLRLS